MTFEKQIPRILLIGIVWGLVEIFVSPVIKSFQPALFGLLMPFISILIILAGRYLAPAYGSVFLMGVIASFMKYMLSGMVLHGAFMAILLEAAMAEIILSLFGLNLLSCLLVGISVEIYSAFHPLLSNSLFCQSTHFVYFKRWLVEIIKVDSTSLTRNKVGTILLLSHTFMGLLSGLLFFVIKKKYLPQEDSI